MLIDTHSHIYSEEFNGEIDDVVKRSLEAGVQKILLPNIDSSSIKRMMELSDNYSNVCFPMIGVHPTSVNEDFEEELEVVEYWLSKRKFYGIGEIGIDLYWDKSFLEEQVYVFRRQLAFAQRYDLPLSIHIRDSFDVVYETITKNYFEGMRGVFHCFTGTAEQAKKVIDLGFKIGVGGIVTFKNAGIDKMIAELNPENLILETDAPYLAPTPFRGKRNESSYLVHIANKVSEIFNTTTQAIEETTSQNAIKLFGI